MLKFLCLLIVFVGVVQAEPNIFEESGRIGRKPVSNQRIPYIWIGKLTTPAKTYCTGSLIGEDLVLTAAHCIHAKGKLVQGDYYFSLPGGEGSEVSYFYYGSLSGAFNKDWAVLRLKKPISNIGHFKIAKQMKTNNLSFAGYGVNAYKLTSMNGCSIKEVTDNLIYHDCDAVPGDSGGAVFHCVGMSCYIDFLHVAAFQHGSQKALTLPRYSKKNANLGCGLDAFSRKVGELIHQ